MKQILNLEKDSEFVQSEIEKIDLENLDEMNKMFENIIYADQNAMTSEPEDDQIENDSGIIISIEDFEDEKKKSLERTETQDDIFEDEVTDHNEGSGEILEDFKDSEEAEEDSRIELMKENHEDLEEDIGLEEIQEKMILDKNDEPSRDNIEEEPKEIQIKKTDVFEEERKEEKFERLKDEAMLNIRNVLTVSKIGQKTADSEVKRISLEIVPPEPTEEVSAEDEKEESVPEFF